MEIQKKSGTKITFDFKEDHIAYKFEDASVSRTSKIRYEGIDPAEIHEIEEKNEWFRNVGTLWLIIGGVSFLMSGSSTALLMLIMGAGCMVFYKMRVVRYSVVSAAEGNLLIIKNEKQHDVLMDKVLNSRREFLRGKYFRIDPANDPNGEIAKFEFLKSKDIISQEEFDDISKDLIARQLLTP